MLKYIVVFVSCLLCSNAIFSQITIDESTLPEINDELEYSIFNVSAGENSFKNQGENLYWEFKNIITLNTITDTYQDISNSEFADSFPNANMIVNLTGFQTAAIKSDNAIEIIGLSISSFDLFDVEGITKFEQPFTHRKTPFNYGEKIEDEFSFVVQFPSDVIPGLDTITLPVPGATLDSVRAITTFFKEEEATAWGTLNVLGNEYEVLKVEQFDSTATKIEIALGLFGSTLWIDASTFAGDMFGELNRGSVTHKFLANNSKHSIIEFREAIVQDSSGVPFISTTGRIKSDIMSSIDNVSHNDNIVIAPNPSYNFIYLELQEGFLNDDTTIEIWSLRGQKVKSISNYQTLNKIEIADLDSGTYILKVVSAKETIQKPFIKI